MALARCKTKCLSHAQRCGGTIPELSCTEAAIVAPRGAENSRDDAMPALNRHTRFDELGKVLVVHATRRTDLPASLIDAIYHSQAASAVETASRAVESAPVNQKPD